jgi:two-component system chemotaxis response regulator CheB
VVVHLAANSPSIVPSILSKAGPLPALNASNGAKLMPGHIYVAPADHHLLIEPGRLRLTRGPKENRFRPAVDPLLRSAAATYGPQVIGVILTGALDDGTAGLWAVKDRGGLAVVQEPSEALAPSMPLSALQHVEVDYRLPLKEMATLLVRLVNEPVAGEGETSMSEAMQIETKIAREDNALAAGVLKLGPPSPYTCPECHGVLVQLQEGSILRFRCHTGHAFSMETLLAGIEKSIDETLWSAVRVLEERMLLLRHLATHVRQQQAEAVAQRLEQKARVVEEQVRQLRRLALAQDPTHYTESSAPTG